MRKRDACSPGRLLSLAGLAVTLGAVIVPGPGSAAADPCPSSNPPNMLRLVAGSSQTAQLGKPFQTNLQVVLANSNRCPVTGDLAGISVDFVAPSGGAGGTFASSGSNVAVVGTDAQGVAVAPVFTANDTAGSYSVHAESDYGVVNLYLTNTATGVAGSIAVVGQTEQAATVNSRYGRPLEVQVLDVNGQPLRGANVTFSIGTGPTGAGATFLGGGPQETETTNADGRATSPPFVANGNPGRFTATASTGGVSTAATFGLDNHAATATITPAADPAQTAAVETRYRRPLEARVVDASGRPIEGAGVTFTIAAAAGGAGAGFLGGGSQANGLTDARGHAASPPLIANGTAGRFTATAAVTGNARPVTYTLRNLAGAPANVTAGAASGEVAPAGTRFPIPLVVTVTDANKNPVAGAVVTFTAPAHGPSGRFALNGPRVRATRVVRVTTDAKGLAVAPAFTGNGRPGGYVVTATVAGSRRSAAFALVNQPRRRA